jgi:hypothetical protein
VGTSGFGTYDFASLVVTSGMRGRCDFVLYRNSGIPLWVSLSSFLVVSDMIFNALPDCQRCC